MTEDSSITWKWKTQYLLTTASNPPEGGTISVSPQEQWHDASTQVSITMAAVSPWVFTKWSGDVTGNNNPVTATISGPMNVTGNLTWGSVCISGYVRTEDGKGISEVKLTLTNGGENVFTGADGFYTLNLKTGWTGKITPSKKGYSFIPAYRRYNTPLTSNQSNQNYTGVERKK